MVLANEQNLQPGNVNHTFTPEETLKGVQRSIEVRQEKSRMKKILRRDFLNPTTQYFFLNVCSADIINR